MIVGAGLGGLACALHLAGAGRQVTVVEREPVAGGRAGRMVRGGYRFDTGPAVLTMPELISEALAAVGERLPYWLDLIAVESAYRAHFPDGSTLDVIAHPARMAGEISRVCGAREADGYLRFVGHAKTLWRLERDDFIERNLDSPGDLLTANLLRLAAAGGFRRLQSKVDHFFRDPRTRRVFSFQAMYAGLAPHRALGLYAVIAYLDAVSGVYFPRGGIHAVPAALAAAGEKLADTTSPPGTTSPHLAHPTDAVARQSASPLPEPSRTPLEEPEPARRHSAECSGRRPRLISSPAATDARRRPSRRPTALVHLAVRTPSRTRASHYHRKTPGHHLITKSCSGARTPRRWHSALCSRDLAVPTGMPRTAAASAHVRPW